jgi:hypothetical protein
MSSNSTGVPLLPDGEKFDGTGYSGFKTKIMALAKARGLGGYLDGTITRPVQPATGTTAQTTPLPPDPTSVYLLTPSLEEYLHRDSMGVALLVLNVKNPVGLGLKVDGTAAEAMQSLEDNHNKKTDMGLVNALRDLHNAYLVPGTPMIEHVARLRNLWQVANDMGAKIEDNGFRSIFISLLGEEWDNVVPVLFTFPTSVEVISFVTMHAERLSNRAPSATANPTHALAANTYSDRDARRAARKNLTCSNASCGAPGKRGHTIADCFWPGGGKEGQWPAWWKGKRPTGAIANTVETFAFAAWTMPEAVVNVYDGTGIQAVSFRGEEVLASPESFMSWCEAANALVPVAMPASISATSSSNAYLAPSSTESSSITASIESFDILDTTSVISSEFELIEPVVPYTEPRGVEQIAVEAFLQAGQPYPGNGHVQEEQRFLAYQTSDTEHIVMDNMVGEDVPIPTRFVRDHDFDIIAWYSEHRRRTLGLPMDDESFDSFTDTDFSDPDSEDGDAGPDGNGGGVVALVAASLGREDVVVVDSGATEHCFRKREDFIEYNSVSREGTAAEGSKFQILGTGVVRKVFTYQGQTKEVLFHAIHTPDITANLVSLSRLDSKGYSVEFGRGKQCSRSPTACDSWRRRCGMGCMCWSLEAVEWKRRLGLRGRGMSQWTKGRGTAGSVISGIPGWMR